MRKPITDAGFRRLAQVPESNNRPEPTMSDVTDAVELIINNESGLYHHFQEYLQDPEVAGVEDNWMMLADYMEDFFQEFKPEIDDMVWDALASHAFNSVNWDAIAQRFIEE